MTKRWLALTALLALPALAYAQAQVTVEVRNPGGSPADGVVSLTPEGSEEPTHRCTTRGGSCSMTGVPGGRYVVRLRPTVGGDAPDPRPVFIPPAGSVTLRVSTR